MAEVPDPELRVLSCLSGVTPGDVGRSGGQGPEYETLGMLGSNLENADLEMINMWNHQTDLLGLDTISLGGVLGFAMELGERGIRFWLHFRKLPGLRRS